MISSMTISVIIIMVLAYILKYRMSNLLSFDFRSISGGHSLTWTNNEFFFYLLVYLASQINDYL